LDRSLEASYTNFHAAADAVATGQCWCVRWPPQRLRQPVLQVRPAWSRQPAV